MRTTSTRSLRSLLPRHNYVCQHCTRHYASIAETPGQPTQAQTEDALPGESPAAPKNLRVGVLLSRAPQITRNLTPFEEAFYFYQRRLDERLALPFTRYFYVKKDTPADIEWKRKVRAAKERGDYNAYGLYRHKDELNTESVQSKKAFQINNLLENAKRPGGGTSPREDGQPVEDELERPHDRITEADRTNDYKSLNRRLDQSLYLLVKGQGEHYELPSASLAEREHLISGGERVLRDSAGRDMNTWFVGHVPIGCAKFKTPMIKSTEDASPSESDEQLELAFYMKARIMAGQANLANNKFGLTDWVWASKDELLRFCKPSYYQAVKAIFTDR